MRGVVLNESYILKNKEEYINDKPIVTIGIICRDCYGRGMNKEQVIKEIHKIMKDTYLGYKPSKWERIIDNTAKLYEKDSSRYKLIDVKEIKITKKEWNKILELNNDVLERIAFIMLVYQKVNKAKNQKSGNWINQSIGDIFKEAKVGYTGDKQRIALNKLYSKGYIKQPNVCYGTSFQVLFADEDSETKIDINSFMNVITYYYEKRLNKKYKSCEVCGARFEINSNKRKYCKGCSVNVKKERDKKNNSRK